jgi:hypothetical protein
MRAISLSLLAPFLSFVTLAACNSGGQTTTETGSSESTDATTSETTTPTGGAVCGDEAIAGDEVCDGADLGAKQCADLDGFLGGALACAADCASFDVSGCEVDPLAAHVVLNEVTSKGALTGPYADLGDAIELYNAGGADADLTGWKLSDDPTFPIDKTYVFPPGSTLKGGAYLVLVEIDKATMVGDLPFGISASNEETLTLATASDVVADALTLQGADAELSYCRLPDGTGAWQTCDQTLGGANVEATSTCGNAEVEPGEDCDGVDLGGKACEDLDSGFTGGTLGCSGLCTFDASLCTTDSTVTVNELESIDDKIELYNSGAAAVDLSGWILTDAPVGPTYDPLADADKLTFLAATSIPAKSYLVIAKGDLPTQHPFGLGAAGDTVSLLRGDLTVASQVTYGDQAAVISFCRLPDGSAGDWTADCTPTFGMTNLP